MKNGKSIEDYMGELDRLDAAGELDDDEPAFQGHTLDLAKWVSYQHIKKALEGLLTTSRSIKEIRGYSKPYPDEQNVTIIVTVSKLAMFTEKETAVLADAMAKAEQFSFVALDNIASLCFIITNIWIN